MYTRPAPRTEMNRLLRLALLLLVLPAAVAGPASPPAGKQVLSEVAGTPPAPDFSLTDIDGRQHRLGDYRGRVVIVNFWATWCPPCREEMPSMQRAWERIRDEGIVMLGINLGEDEDAIFEFTAGYPVDFPLLMDRDSSVIRAWGVRGLPTTFVIDPRGRIRYRAVGGRAWDDAALLARVRALAGQ